MSCFLKRSLKIASLCLALVLAPGAAWSQPPVGYEDEEKIVQNADLTKVRFPIICLTNRKSVAGGFSSVEKNTDDFPAMFARFCTVDAATHVLGKRADFSVEQQDTSPADLSRFLQPAPGKTKRFLVFVHGFNLNFKDSLPAVAQLAFDIDRHSVPVVFSWPSGEGAGYVTGRDNSRLSGRALAKGMELLQSRVGNNIEVDLVCHSLGGETTLEALEELSKPEFAETMKKTTVTNLVFIAPDVAVDVFRDAMDWPIMASIKRTTLYADANDGVLKVGSQKLSGNPRIGAKRDFRHLRVETLDVTNLSSSFNPFGAHTSILDKPVGLMDLFMLLKLDQGAFGRNLYWKQGVWLLRN